MEELVDVRKGIYWGCRSKKSNFPTSMMISVPSEAREMLGIEPPARPKFKVLVDRDRRRIIYELQDVEKDRKED